MGWSPMHISSVALVKNLMPGRLSPQFHVVFDPWFETVHEHGTTAPAAWDVMSSQPNHEVDDNDPVSATLSDDWLTKEELAKRQHDNDVESAWKQAKPTAKQEGVRAPSNSSM